MRRISFLSLALMSCAALVIAGCDGDGTNTGGAGGRGGDGGSAGATGGVAGSGGTGGSTCTPTDEQCDGLDNNCDGQVDEGCPCKDGDTQSCYSGPMGTEGIGACAAGTQTCDLTGTWGPCTGEVLPGAEACNAADDDCNGTVDDMGVLTCGVGVCMNMVIACENGTPGMCIPGQPSVEVCDGLDNNCNQLVDETFPMAGGPCDSGQPGVCQAGKLDCVTENGVTAAKCVADVMPGQEACDGLDNDCNGTVDDNVPGTGGACSTGQLGPCAMGTISCKNNQVDCFSDFTSGPETCDGVDNDCNGNVDDPPGNMMACNTGLLGECAAGVQMCQSGVFGCVQTNQAQATDMCGDNKDNDCDGTVDEGCLYTFTGIQTNLPVATLTGWQQCYIDNYANNSTPLTTILGQCNKAKLLLACRLTGSTTLTAAAWAPKTDVIFDTGTGNTPHDANGVGWYYNNSWSWGFAQQGDVLSRNSCDTAGTNPDKRLCWHTGGGNINTGWRCGTATGLNFVSTYERLVYHAD